MHKIRLKKEVIDSAEAARRWPIHTVLPNEQAKYTYFISSQFKSG